MTKQCIDVNTVENIRYEKSGRVNCLSCIRHLLNPSKKEKSNRETTILVICSLNVVLAVL